MTGKQLYEMWREFVLKHGKEHEPGDWTDDLYAHEKAAWNDLAWHFNRLALGFPLDKGEKKWRR